MRRRRARIAAVALGATVLLTACDPGGLAPATAPTSDASPPPPSPTAAPSTSTSATATPPPTVIATGSPAGAGASGSPTIADDIDIEYVQGVLDALDEAFTPGIQASSDAGTLAPELLERMDALWTDEWRARTQPLFAEDFTENAELLDDDVETRYHRVDELVVAQPDCVIVRATVDFAAWLADDAEAPPPVQFVTALVPRGDSPSANDLNPTDWLVNYDAEPAGEVTEAELCGEQGTADAGS